MAYERKPGLYEVAHAAEFTIRAVKVVTPLVKQGFCSVKILDSLTATLNDQINALNELVKKSE